MGEDHPQGYSRAVLDHFLHPRNVGEIADADGTARVGDPACGDVLVVWLRVDAQQRLTDVKFRCRGCPTAIACASVMTELAIGRDLDEASAITDETIEDTLGGLPPMKRHCSNLAAYALYEAIYNYIGRGVQRLGARGDAAC